MRGTSRRGKMKELLDQSQQSIEDGANENLENEILTDTSGKQPNNIIGMGYGMEAPISCQAEGCSDQELKLCKQLEQAELELQHAHSKMYSLIQTRKEKMKLQKYKCSNKCMKKCVTCSWNLCLEEATYLISHSQDKLLHQALEHNVFGFNFLETSDSSRGYTFGVLDIFQLQLWLSFWCSTSDKLVFV